MTEDRNDNQSILRFPDLSRIVRRKKDTQEPASVPAEGVPVERSPGMEELRFYATRSRKAETWAKWCRKQLKKVHKEKAKRGQYSRRGLGTQMREVLDARAKVKEER